MIRIISFISDGTSKYTADPIYTYADGDPAAVLDALMDEGVDDDIIGIQTGGSFFVRNDQPLTGPYIMRIMDSYDVILPFESGSGHGSAMFITRRRLAGDLYQSISTGGLDRFIREKHLRVKSESIQKTDPEIWNTGYKRIEAIQGYMDAVLSEYIALRQNGGFDGSFAEEDPYTGDFDGKTPVWICWWQGLESAPDLIRACVASIERNLPESVRAVLITQDNYTKYVTLSPAIVDKFRRGVISVTHLSDILRAELLYRYGGMWIDATYYVSGPIPEELLSQQLYSLRFDPPLWGMDIQRGRWTLSLLVAGPRHPAMQFLMEGLWLYWERADELVDYFTVDYVCDAGYRHIESIKAAFDSIEPSSPAVYDLQLMMNQRISETGTKHLISDSLFYKINRRNEYRPLTEHGFMTYYGYIIRKAGISVDNIRSSHSGISVSCTNEGELIKAVREINPDRVIDVDGYYASKGRISRGVIDDIILHPLIIECACDGAMPSPVYDRLLTVLPDEKPVAEIMADGSFRLLCYDGDYPTESSGIDTVSSRRESGEYIEGLISIIVPVYNSEKTLERCVGSLVSQTYGNIEIILVDDASTDSSRELMMRLEQADPDRIMVVCSDTNRGPGGARNVAFEYARGEYIGFVDSDDYVQSSFYEKLVTEMERGGYDIVDCGYYNEAKDSAMLHTGRDTRGVLDRGQKCELIVSGGYLWSRLYRRQLFEAGGIQFRENCILEDSEVLVSLIAHARSAGAVEETLYWYSASEGSASQKHSAASYIGNIYDAMDALANLKDTVDDYEELRPAIEYEIIQMYDYGVVMALQDARTGHTLDTLSELKRLRELRLQIATAGYSNKYVISKLEKADLDVIRQNDISPEILMRKVLM